MWAIQNTITMNDTVSSISSTIKGIVFPLLWVAIEYENVLFLLQVQLRTEVLRFASSTRLGFEFMTSKS